MGVRVVARRPEREVAYATELTLVHAEPVAEPVHADWPEDVTSSVPIAYTGCL